ncbi:hypothetical protein CR513_57988, partial [Mucuna pruriens]
MYNSYSTLVVTCVASYPRDDVALELEPRWLWVADMERHLDLPAHIIVKGVDTHPILRFYNSSSSLSFHFIGGARCLNDAWSIDRASVKYVSASESSRDCLRPFVSKSALSQDSIEYSSAVSIPDLSLPRMMHD